MRRFLTLGLTVLGLSAIGFAAVADEGEGEAFPPTDGRTNLALGKTVTFSPRPNYAPTAKGDSDATDLTDGETVARKDHSLWFDSAAAGWSYPGRVNLSVDLGAECDVDEIAIRLQNGSGPGNGLFFPGWVEAFVGDGERYAKVAEFSRWNQGDFEKFGIGRERGRHYVDCLRFRGLKARGRFVGLRIYGGATMASDELYVFGQPADAAPATPPKPEPNGFTVSHPQFYFHKPYLELATNIPLPVPIGLAMPADAPKGAEASMTLDLPPGLELVGGNVGPIQAESAKARPADEPGWTRYVFEGVSRPEKDAGRLYLKAGGWKDGQAGELRFEFADGSWKSASLSVPARAAEVPKAPRLKRIMATMGWWDATAMGWPDELEAFETLGLNTFGVFSNRMPPDRGGPRRAMIEEARKRGFFISNIDSPIHAMLTKHRNDPEIHDRFEDGSTNDQVCVSYRGRFYKEEIERFAGRTAAVRPDFGSVDIELWSWRGPADAEKCTRCRADFEKSGLKTWAEWRKAKGLEIIRDLMTAAQAAVRETGGEPFDSGAYDFRPGETYQSVFDFDALYPGLLQHGQVSSYTGLEPADLAFIGDEVRKDRARLPKSDVMPWNTPGDAGTFPGEAFQWSLLENYCNGARGIWFWSSRMWDSEDLIAYNRVIRAIAPVEDVIVDGDLIGADAEVVGPGRVSGMKLDGRTALLVADYLGETDGAVRLKLNVAPESVPRDLLTGEPLDVRLPPDGQTVTIPLQGRRARLLEVSPR